MTPRYAGEPHPYLVAAILVSGSQRKVAEAVGVHTSTLHRWTRRPDIPAEFLPQLTTASANLIQDRMDDIARRFFGNPAVLLSKDFQRDADDLEIAHRLRFGCGAWEDGE